MWGGFPKFAEEGGAPWGWSLVCLHLWEALGLPCGKKGGLVLKTTPPERVIRGPAAQIREFVPRLSPSSREVLKICVLVLGKNPSLETLTLNG